MNKNQISAMQQATARWLAGGDKLLLKDPEKHLEELRDVLRFHEHRYYIMNDPLIADGEYDRLFELLSVHEQKHPELITADSPTQRVAPGLIKDFPKATHLVPMLSLQNSYNEDDLRDWDRRVREGTGESIPEYCVEPKFDGASVSLIYSNDQFERAATRGDGVTGDDISPNIKRIRSLPLKTPMHQYGIEQLEIRGEVLMNKNNFYAFNEMQVANGLPPLANPRNAAAGTLRIKDSSEVTKRNLEAFVYHIGYFSLLPNAPLPKALTTHSGSLELLWSLGFRSPVKEMKVLKGIDAVIEYTRKFEEKRDDLPYEIDGMVIKVNSITLQEQLGSTTHHPRWAIAFKFKARQATSTLVAVSYQVGRTGAVTPVAHIKPVQVGGVTVSNISMHNEDYIREKDLRIGDEILIERSGDVIPQIVKNMPETRKGTEEVIVFPKVCPACGDQLERPPDEAVWRCVNLSCDAQVVEGIIHFVSKDAMDIRSFGEANVRRFFEKGFLKNIPGIYNLPFDKIRSLEGMGEKSVNTLRENIEASKQQPLHRLIYALGIRYVGETTAKALASQVNNLFDLATMPVEELMQTEDVGVKVATSIQSFFRNPDNMQMIEELKHLGLNMEGKKAAPGTGEFAGKTFLFTGTLNHLKRAEAEQLVEEKGGKILSSVSAKLNYLVVGEAAGSKLDKARKLQTVQIIPEEEFLKMITT